MSFNKSLPLLTAALAVLGLSSCDTPAPESPRVHLPGLQQYYNQSLGFSLSYPGVLSIRVDDRAVAGSPDASLQLTYPGNEQAMFRLSTYDPAMAGHVRQYMVPGTETTQPVGGETGARFLIEDQGADQPGETLQHVTVVHRGKLFVMTGKGETFEEVLASFEFIAPTPPVGR